MDCSMQECEYMQHDLGSGTPHLLLNQTVGTDINTDIGMGGSLAVCERVECKCKPDADACSTKGILITYIVNNLT